MFCLDDDDYDTPQIVGRTRTYWHPTRHCYVTAFVGELKVGKRVPDAAPALVREGRSIAPGEIVYRLDDLLRRRGPLDAKTIAEMLGCSKSSVHNCIYRDGERYGRERRGRNILYSLA